jgi:putative transposase
MSIKYKFQDQQQLHFITFAVVNWIDLFIRNEYKDILLQSWRHCQLNKGLEIYGWCIMTSHVHLIIGSHGEKMEDIMRDMKKHTSLALKAAIKNHPGESRREWMLWMMERAGKKNSQNVNFQLWQQDNPAVAGIVDRPEDYLYSSARDYCGIPGLIEINLVDPMIY